MTNHYSKHIIMRVISTNVCLMFLVLNIDDRMKPISWSLSKHKISVVGHWNVVLTQEIRIPRRDWSIGKTSILCTTT
jgi:hypothetical protein